LDTLNITIRGDERLDFPKMEEIFGPAGAKQGPTHAQGVMCAGTASSLQSDLYEPLHAMGSSHHHHDNKLVPISDASQTPHT